MKKRIFALLCALMMLVTPSTGSFHDEAEYLHVGHAHAEDVTTPSDMEPVGDPVETDVPTSDPEETDAPADDAGAVMPLAETEQTETEHVCAAGSSYKSNGNGTHSALCGECGEPVGEAVQCTYQSDWWVTINDMYHAHQCMYCNAIIDSTKTAHSNNDGEYRQEGDTHYVECDFCECSYGTEAHADQGNGYCKCGKQLVFVHTCTPDGIYEEYGDTHHCQWCGECGSVVESTIAECVDAGNGCCVCGRQMVTQPETGCSLCGDAYFENQSWKKQNATGGTIHVLSCPHGKYEQSHEPSYTSDIGSLSMGADGHYRRCDHNCGLYGDIVYAHNGNLSTEVVADSDTHKILCGYCEVTANTPAEPCVANENYWKTDERFHYRVCAKCDEKMESTVGQCDGEGEYVYVGEEVHDWVCVDCGQGYEEDHVIVDGYCECGYQVVTTPVYPCECGAELQNVSWKKSVDESGNELHVLSCPHGQVSLTHAPDYSEEGMNHAGNSAGEAGHYPQCRACSLHSDVVVPHGAYNYYASNGTVHQRACDYCSMDANGADVSFCTGSGSWGSKWDGTETHFMYCSVCWGLMESTQESCTAGDEYGHRNTSEGHFVRCKVCAGPMGETLSHVMDGPVSSVNDLGHAESCSVCGWADPSNLEPHTLSEDYKSDWECHYKYCTVCNSRIYSTEGEHTYEGSSFVPNDEGNNHKLPCTVCGYGEIEYCWEFQTKVCQSTGDAKQHQVIATCSKCGSVNQYTETHGSNSCAIEGCTQCGQADALIWKDFVDHNLGEWQAEGNKHFRICGDCGKTFDEGEHDRVCNKVVCDTCGVAYTGDENVWHDIEYEYVVDDAGHWNKHTCKNCGNVEQSCEAHTIACDSTDGLCTRCNGYYPESKAKHTYQWGEAKYDATKHWYICTVCGEVCNEAPHDYDCGYCYECFMEVPAGEDPDHVGFYGYDYDEDKHWGFCDMCGDFVLEGPHSFDEDGLCVCGYEKVVNPTESTDPEPTPGPSDPVYPCECGAELKDLAWREKVIDGEMVHVYGCPHGEFNGDPHDARFNDCYSFSDAGHAYKCADCDIFTEPVAHDVATICYSRTDDEHFRVCNECVDHVIDGTGGAHDPTGPIKSTGDGAHATSCTICEMPLDYIDRENCYDSDGEGHCDKCGFTMTSVLQCPTCGLNPQMENRKIDLNGEEYHAWACPCGTYYHMDSLHAPQYVGYASFGYDGHALYCEKCPLYGELVAHSGETRFAGNDEWHVLICQECEHYILDDKAENHTKGDVIRPHYDGRHGVGCSICGCAIESELVPCTPGEEVRHFGDGTHARICTVCDEPVPDTAEDCVAGDKAWIMGDEFGPNGTHILICAECEEPMGDPVPCEFAPGSNRYQHGDLCSVCGAIVNGESHHFDKFERDENGHRGHCEVCGMSLDEPHELELGNSEADKRCHVMRCQYCGYESGQTELHSDADGDGQCDVCNNGMPLCMECAHIQAIRVTIDGVEMHAWACAHGKYDPNSVHAPDYSAQERISGGEEGHYRRCMECELFGGELEAHDEQNGYHGENGFHIKVCNSCWHGDNNPNMDACTPGDEFSSIWNNGPTGTHGVACMVCHTALPGTVEACEAGDEYTQVWNDGPTGTHGAACKDCHAPIPGTFADCVPGEGFSQVWDDGPTGTHGQACQYCHEAMRDTIVECVPSEEYGHIWDNGPTGMHGLICQDCNEPIISTSEVCTPGSEYSQIWEDGPTGTHGVACEYCHEAIQSTREACTPGEGYAFYDFEYHAHECTVCNGPVGELVPHTEGDAFVAWGPDGHVAACADCGEPMVNEHGEMVLIPHDQDGWFTDRWDHVPACSACGEVKWDEVSWESHVFDYSSAKPGKDAYTHLLSCSVCGEEVEKRCKETDDFSKSHQAIAGDKEHHQTVFTCNLCGNVTTDKTAHVLSSCGDTDCGLCGEEDVFLWHKNKGHNYSDMIDGGDYCYYMCLDCGVVLDRYEHLRDCDSSVCKMCGAAYTGANMEHDLQWSQLINEEGHGEQAECSKCDYTEEHIWEAHWLNCNNQDGLCWCGYPAPEGSEGSHGYSFDDIEYDATHHWATCVDCGELMKEEHTWFCGVCGFCDATAPAGTQMDHYMAFDYDWNEEIHWSYCYDCEQIVYKGAHEYDDEGNCICGDHKAPVTPTPEPTVEPTPVPTPEPTAKPTAKPHVHNLVSDETPATCTEDGLLQNYCFGCGAVVSTEIIPMTGHAYGAYTDNGNGTHSAKCAACDDVHTVSCGLTTVDMGSMTCTSCAVCGYASYEMKVAEVVVAVVAETKVVEEVAIEIVLPETEVEEGEESTPVVPDGVTLVVNETVFEAPVEILPELEVKVEKVYNIALVLEGEKIEPKGSMKVAIPMTEDEITAMEGKTLMMLTEDGELIEVVWEIVDGKLVIVTDVLGMFVLTDKPVTE